MTPQNRAKSPAEEVFEAEFLHKSNVFAALQQSGVVEGEFDSTVWRYKGVRLKVEESERAETSNVDGQEKFADQLFRAYILGVMQQGLSTETIRSRTYAFRLVRDKVGDSISGWCSIQTRTLNEIKKELLKANSVATAYQRTGAISKLMDYLNSLSIHVEGRLRKFLPRQIRWAPGIKNPCRHQVDRTSIEGRRHSEKKLYSDIHVAIGKARSMIINEAGLEPKPGFDRIRLEALCFAFALGLRIGEVLSLDRNAVGYLDVSDSTFVRVKTEKGQSPAARPVSSLWESLVCEAHDYLLNQTATARARAKDIEENGFAFVYAAVTRFRESNPLSNTRRAQMKSLNLDPSRYAGVDELTAVFDLSKKEFWAGGRFGEHRVFLPKPVGAHVFLWLEDRWRLWDWCDYSIRRSDSRMGQYGMWRLSITQIAEFCDASRSSVPKAKWFNPDLRRFLVSLSRCGAFDPKNKSLGENFRKGLQDEWMNLKEKILSNRGEVGSVVVDLDKLCGDLRDRYHHHLNLAFKKNIPMGQNESRVDDYQRKEKSGSVKLSERLLVVWEGQFHSQWTNGILPRPLNRSDIYNYLSKSSEKKTIFERLDMRDSEGKIVSVTPHMIRHWVTTEMLKSGPSEELVDLWMGREVGQARQYDHRTPKERAESARDRYLNANPPDDHLGRNVDCWREEGVDEDEIESLVSSKLRVLHFVPWGACSRELFLSPCDRGLMCLRGFGTGGVCESFHIDPSSTEERAAIEDLREKYLNQLRIVDPHLADLKATLISELNSDESLDQHIRFMLEVVQGCDQALAAYDVPRNSTDERLINVSRQGGGSR